MRSIACLISLLVLAGCGGAKPKTDVAPGRAPLTPSQAHPSPPAAPAAFVHVADSAAARTQLGYVSRRAPSRLAAAVGARSGSVRVGTRIVAPSVVPARTVLANEAISTAQSCLGDPVAQTIIGPARLGRDAAIGVAVAPSQRGGLELRVCGAPHFRRHLTTFARVFRARFGERAVESELGERAMVSGSVPLREVDGRTVAGLLSGGRWLDRLFTD